MPSVFPYLRIMLMTRIELEGDTLTWELVSQRIISLRSKILVDIPVAFALLGLRIISGLSIVCKKRLFFCFVCCLFKDKTKSPGGDAFVNGGFNNWNMKARLKRHIGNQC